jgi:hypothetical protein
MEKTKYIKVAVSDRLPEKSKCVKVIDQSDNIYDGFITDKDVWQVYTQFEYGNIEYWLEEVPDHEEEMREILQYMLENGFCVDKHGEDLSVKVSNLIKIKEQS